MKAWFDAPASPPKGSIRVDPGDTPRRFSLRVLTALPRYIVPASLLACLHQAGEALVAVIVGQAVDRAVTTSDAGALLFWLLVLGLDFAMLSFSYRFGSRLGWLGMNRVQHDVRMLVTDHLLDPRRGNGPGRLIGSQLSVATSDAFLLARVLGLAVYGPSMVVGILVCAAVLGTISWPLGVGVFAGAVFVLVAGDRLGGAFRTRIGAQQQSVADASGTAADLVDGLRVIKGIGAASVASDRYAALSQDAMRARILASRAKETNRAALSLIGGLFVVVIGAAAGLMAASGRLTVGELITVVMIAQFVLEPVRGLAFFVSLFWNPALAAAGRLLDVLRDAPPREETAGRELPAAAGRSTCSTCSDWGVHVRADVTLDASPGEHLTLVADEDHARGALDLLTRTRAPGPTERAQLVAADDTRVDLTDLPTASVRKVVLVAPHDAHLFAGSARDNIALAPASTPVTVAAAIGAAACDQVAQMLPDGLDSPVGESGVRLSGGQRQRVSLARALAADPPVLVLLEPTSAVDSVTEQHIAEAVGRLRAGRTTIVVTASPAWRRRDTRVVDLRVRAEVAS